MKRKPERPRRGLSGLARFTVSRAQDDGRSSSAPNVPNHVDEAVRSVAQLHSDHHGRTTAPQRR